jgi:acyl carrier protein
MKDKNDNEIKKTIKNIISKVTRINVDEITDYASLRDELYIDSLQASQIIILIQDEFNIKIDEVEIFNIDNINEIIVLLKEYTN